MKREETTAMSDDLACTPWSATPIKAAPTPHEVAAVRRRLVELFEGACASLGVKPLDTTFGLRCMATFATSGEAESLAGALRTAGAENIDVHHWDPRVEPDFDRDEYQVSWG